MSERKGTKALELWCKRLVRDCPEIQIDNMTTSWRNGMAFCALVHHFRPDLIDMSKLKPENIYENNQLAFSVAEKHLGIPALLDPEDMVANDVPDRLSILTYLSQFYQRLGHTVNTKVSESETKAKATTEAAQPIALIKFGKTGLDKCTACSLPVYLAQRLMVSHKLYHRRCFRCTKCSGHLNPKNYHVIEGSDFSCDSCKNEKSLLKYLNNNHDQMGMLAFNDATPKTKLDVSKDDIVSPKQKSRPSSILEKISMFEKNDRDTNMDSKISNISIKDSTNTRHKELSGTSVSQSELDLKNIIKNDNTLEIENIMPNSTPEKTYKSNINKFNFLQTQLLGDSLPDVDKTAQKIEFNTIQDTKHNDEDCISNKNEISDKIDEKNDCKDNSLSNVIKEDSAEKDINITDDIRIGNILPTANNSVEKEVDVTSTEVIPDNLVVESDSTNDLNKTEEVLISVPPRRKKQNSNIKPTGVKHEVPKVEAKKYPDHLNPFSDDEEEEDPPKGNKKESTNPFGSSDEEDDDVPPINAPPKVPVDTSTPIKRLIAANPFWSDGEEPSTDEDEDHSRSSKGTYSSLAMSTPNLPGSTPRRKKLRAPPPPVITVSEAAHSHATSMDDVASISSLSSYNSTIHSDQKSGEKSTPRLKKRPAPTPPDNLSTASVFGDSIEKEVDTSGLKNTSGFDACKKKGPAPGLPLPERREVKLQMSPEELQVQLDLLETQQLGLERQGVLIEKMIRDKCEGDEPSTVPQEEVEDLVIQLCELVNEKNDLFRKQTELMYIRRQQRLEQEQADIEHEIRVIQSRPAVNRIDADKAREEQLVSRLVEIVRMRDELVQQLDAERRRERQEDLAIAASIASKRASRNSDSTNSSMKSAEVSTTSAPKKNKVKDKVKKQFKKAKHTLIHKKKDDTGDKKEIKENKVEKEKKSK